MSSRLRFSTARADSRLRVSALVLAAVLLAGCDSPRAPTTLRVGLAAAPATLDPRLATDASAARLCRLLYSALVDFDAHARPVPALARWHVLSPVHYRFELVRDVRFHDGGPLTARDVVATYRALLDPARASPLRGPLAHIAQVEARDDRTIDFTLARADAYFPGLLTIGILRAADAALPALGPRPVGSGPFRLRAPFTPVRIALARQRDGQAIDFVVVPNETTRALKLARGELDLAQGGFAPELTEWLARRPGIRVTQRAGTVFTYLGLNLAEGPTRDPRIRQAIARAIDREAIITHVFRGQARAASAILVPEHWAGHPGLALSPPDPAAARALLAAAGYSAERPLRLIYKTSNDHFRRRVATIFQQQLRAVGIELAIRSYDWGTFYGDIRRGNFQIYGLSWVGLQLPDIFRHAFHSSAIPPVGANRGRFTSATVDALIEAAERAPDEPARVALYRRLQAQLLDELPAIPLWYEDIVVVQGPRVRGYDTDPSGNFDGLAEARWRAIGRPGDR